MCKLIFVLLVFVSFSAIAKDTEKFLKSGGSEKLQKFVKDNKSFFDKILLDHIVAMDNCFMNEKENYKCKERYFGNSMGRIFFKEQCVEAIGYNPKKKLLECYGYLDEKKYFEVEKMVYQEVYRWNVFVNRQKLISSEYVAGFTPFCGGGQPNCKKVNVNKSSQLNLMFKKFSLFRFGIGDWNYNISSFTIVYNKKLEKYEDLINKDLIVGMSLTQIH